jgi:predicted nucleic acid-binding protein
MSVESFLDTNLFIYQLEALDERKAATADAIIRRGIETGDACISYQVVQECLNTVVRKAEIPLDALQARSYLETVLGPLWRVYPNAALYRRALDLQARFRFSFYDSLIVAAALQAGCSRLLTEDLQHGQQVDGVTIENPFKEG